jgi:uncharacterized spore protein YtfJ
MDTNKEVIMSANSSFSQNIDTLFTDLHNLVKTDTVVGSPVAVGDKTIIPLMTVTLGYGSTGMGNAQNSNANANSNAAGGVGLGARVSTNAIVVIDKDTVMLHPTSEKNNMAQLMEKVPEAIATMGQNITQKTMEQTQNQTQTQGEQQ